MNIISLIKLFKNIYGKNKPDIEYIQKQGLLAVKIAQHYALRVDFLNPNVCYELSKLYRANVSIPPKDIIPTISKYAGKEFFKNFSNIEEKPIATASIGQVHKAVLVDGRKVVIKFIKDDYKKNFLSDIKKIKRIFNLITYFYPKIKRVFDPLAAISHIEDYTLLELDLRNEVKGIKTLSDIANSYKNFYDTSRLKFPIIYEDLTNENIMVSQLIEGKTFDELIEEGNLPYYKLIEVFYLHGFFIFIEGVFHGDLHPANIILGNDGFIYFIDNASISRITDKIRCGLFEFFEFLCKYDYDKCAEKMNEMSNTKIDDLKMKKFKSDFFKLYKDFKGKTVSEISLTQQMMKTIKLAVNYGMSFDKEMFSVIKSLMYMDGMVLRCNPKADLIKDIEKAVSQMKMLFIKTKTEKFR